MPLLKVKEIIPSSFLVDLTSLTPINLRSLISLPPDFSREMSNSIGAVASGLPKSNVTLPTTVLLFSTNLIVPSHFLSGISDICEKDGVVNRKNRIAIEKAFMDKQ
ncbi:hypothetical protein D3C87_1380110 [compost metagenome]